MIFNRDGHGAEELRQATSSYYANADFLKISGIVSTVQQEIAIQIGTEVMASIDADYNAGSSTPLISAAQRCVGFMAVLRYFRLNDISHETDGRKVKMDSENERRPFEWQLERDDQMHLQEYYNAYDQFVTLLQDNPVFQQSDLYRHQQLLCITSAADFRWLTGIEATPYLYMRMIPALYQAQLKVEERLGFPLHPSTSQRLNPSTPPLPSPIPDPVIPENDEKLQNLARAAVAHRAVAIFVRHTEMHLLPSGAFREAVSAGGSSRNSTTNQLHDFYQHMLEVSDAYVKDAQCRRDIIDGDHTSHLVVPENDTPNKFFIL